MVHAGMDGGMAGPLPTMMARVRPQVTEIGSYHTVSRQAFE